MTPALCSVGDVRKAFCQIDQSFGETIDVSHFQTPSDFET
jgi:hypothetical protein